jgi:hypothetical protein
MKSTFWHVRTGLHGVNYEGSSYRVVCKMSTDIAYLLTLVLRVGD